MLENIFHLKENHTDVKTEIMAGITTFMTMAYILAVNPNILSASGMDSEAVLIATALASFLLALRLWLCLRLSVCTGTRHGPERLLLLPGRSHHGLQLAVGPDGRLCRGIIFIVLSLTNVREASSMPSP